MFDLQLAAGIFPPPQRFTVLTTSTFTCQLQVNTYRMNIHDKVMAEHTHTERMNIHGSSSGEHMQNTHLQHSYK